MNGNLILIYDKRVEISNKYKKNIEQNHCAKTLIIDDKELFIKKLLELEPDLILISESVAENLTNLSQEIRKLNLKFRPVIIILSKSSFLEDKTNALNAGADDFLSEPMEIDEFLARINAHLRRTIEENASPITQLPNENYTNKIINRTLNENKPFSMLLIGIDNYIPYREIYGDIPANKLLQAFSAILNATLEPTDFVGQFNSENFLIITSCLKAEKLADYLNYAFTEVAKRFYSKDDAQRGYILLHGENKAGCKIPMMTTSIGIINSELINYPDKIQVVNSLNKVYKLAKTLVGASKVIDRPLITSDEIIKLIDEKTIIVIEEDEDLAYLLETTLKIQGFNPIVYKNHNVEVDELLNASPSAIIIDSGKNSNIVGFELCKKIKSYSNQNIKIIFTDTAHEKEEILNAGADLYLPKPYDLMNLFQWIYKLLN